MLIRPMLIRPRAGIIDPASVFQSRLRTGSGATRSETPGFRPDLVWIKSRGAAGSHYLYDTDRGPLQEINTDTTAATVSLANSLTSFDAAGYSLGTATAVNGSGATFVDWLFKEYPGFFKKGVISHTNGTADTVDLSSLGVVGAVVAKITNTTGNWPLWHRSLDAGNNVFMNTTAAQSTTGAIVSVSGTTMTLAAAAPTGTYEYYAWAHQPGGIIQCGGYATINGTVAVDIGWDVQWLLTGAIFGIGPKGIYDTARGLTASAAVILAANTNAAEASSTAIRTAPNGWTDTQSQANTKFYMAIKKAY